MSNRYFAQLSYLGTNYAGWQKQPNAVSVQSTIEEALSTILNQPIEIMGCGRTDTGVHAKNYYIHFDTSAPFPKAFIRRLNKFLPRDIAMHDILPVAPEAHVRFDATRRAYEYHISLAKNPFSQQTAWFYPYPSPPDFTLLQEAASLLLDYTEFLPFCKTNSDAKTMLCHLSRSEWIMHEEEQKLVFHIAANRFLRGMVRLIVGMCINVATDKLDLDKVREALDQQIPLAQSWSAPAEGLFLTDIRYPYI